MTVSCRTATAAMVPVETLQVFVGYTWNEHTCVAERIGFYLARSERDAHFRRRRGRSEPDKTPLNDNRGADAVMGFLFGHAAAMRSILAPPYRRWQAASHERACRSAVVAGRFEKSCRECGRALAADAQR
jgi:hypothetical protein